MWGLFLFWSMRSVAHVGLSSPTRDQTHIRYVGKQILNHWNNREVLTFLKCYLWNQFSFLKHNVKYFREGRSREAFWGLIILVFLRAIFCCIHVRIHPCLEARETSLSLRGATVHGATVHGATLCSIHSSLFWSFSNCIVSFTGFSARIQKYLKLSVSLAFHLLPFPKLKKFIRQTHSLFFFVSTSNNGTTIYPSALHCASTGASRSVQMLFLWPLPTWPSLYQIHPSSLMF